MTSGWGLRCSNDFDSGCSQPDVLQGIESDTTIVCPVDAVVEPSKFCVNAPSGKASCNVSVLGSSHQSKIPRGFMLTSTN